MQEREREGERNYLLPLELDLAPQRLRQQMGVAHRREGDHGRGVRGALAPLARQAIPFGCSPQQQ